MKLSHLCEGKFSGWSIPVFGQTLLFPFKTRPIWESVLPAKGVQCKGHVRRSARYDGPNTGHKIPTTLPEWGWHIDAEWYRMIQIPEWSLEKPSQGPPKQSCFERDDFQWISPGIIFGPLFICHLSSPVSKHCTQSLIGWSARGNL